MLSFFLELDYIVACISEFKRKNLIDQDFIECFKENAVIVQIG